MAGSEQLSRAQLLVVVGEQGRVIEEQATRIEALAALHVAARLVHGGRRLRLKIDRTWRWATAPAQAFQRLTALPTPLT